MTATSATLDISAVIQGTSDFISSTMESAGTEVTTHGFQLDEDGGLSACYFTYEDEGHSLMVIVARDGFLRTQP
jgi:hypothetical protein